MKPKRIPISAAKLIAKKYGYHQVVIHARHVDETNGMEWMTTYGVNKAHCDVAARIGGLYGDLVEGRAKIVRNKPPVAEEQRGG